MSPTRPAPIELGMVRHHPEGGHEPVLEAPPPGWAQRRGWRWLPAMVAVLLAGAADRTGGRTSELVATDLRTGEAVWTVPGDSDQRMLLGWEDHADMWERWQRPPYVLTLAGDGRLARYDAATGAVRAVTHAQPAPAVSTLAPPAWPAQLAAYHQSFVGPFYGLWDGLAVLPGAGGGVVAYDVDTLGQRWRLPGALVAVPCAAVVCVAADSWSTLTGVDRATGAARWSWECGEPVPPAEYCALLPTVLGPDGPILVLRWVAGAGVDATASWVVEPATGEITVDLRQWRMLAPGSGDAGSLLIWSDGAVPDPELGGLPGSMWLARLTVDPVRLEVLGLVEADSCGPSGKYLVCWRPGAGLEVREIGV